MPALMPLENELLAAEARSAAFLARVERERASRSLTLGMAWHQAAMLGGVHLVSCHCDHVAVSTWACDAVLGL